MDPYEVLGIKYNSNWKEVRKAYKKLLIQTHPDKMGNHTFFNLVQEAYKSIKTQHETQIKERSYPLENKEYQQHPTKYNNDFNVNKFNQLFEQYSKLYNESDPFLNGGYKTCNRLNYQEDLVDLKKKKIIIPKRELVLYKEPEALASSSLMENLYHLGVNKIEDFTCVSGSDYMRAYSEEADLIDNRQEYTSLDHITNARLQQSFQLTKEDRKQQKSKQKKKDKMEQMRRSQMHLNDKTYSKISSYIENRIL